MQRNFFTLTLMQDESAENGYGLICYVLDKDLNKIGKVSHPLAWHEGKKHKVELDAIKAILLQTITAFDDGKGGTWTLATEHANPIRCWSSDVLGKLFSDALCYSNHLHVEKF